MKLEEKIVHSVLATAINVHYNEELSRTPYYDKEVKKKGNLYLNHILKKEKYFEGFLEAKETAAEDVHTVFFDFIQTLGKVSIPDMENVKYIIEAYQKDPKSIQGIVNKILN